MNFDAVCWPVDCSESTRLIEPISVEEKTGNSSFVQIDGIQPVGFNRLMIILQIKVNFISF